MMEVIAFIVASLAAIFTGGLAIISAIEGLWESVIVSLLMCLINVAIALAYSGAVL